jgi:hypothetical protein
VVTPARGIAAGIVSAAALAAALVALLGGRSAHVDAPAQGIGVSADVSPRSALFGDRLDATAVVLVDRHQVDPSSVKLQGPFGAYGAAAPPQVTRTTDGSVTRIVYRYRLQCLTDGCLPPDPTTHGTRMFGLAPLRLTFKQVDGTPGAALVRWPLVNVATRMSAFDMALLSPIDQPPFHATVALPRPTYAVSPTLLVALLAAGAALLLAAAGLLGLRFARAPAATPVVQEPPPPPRPVEPVRVLSPLERALHLLERARERGAVPDQRKALENLAGELRRTGARDLALSASVLAWAERPPGTDATGALAAAVQRQIAEEANGHR